MDTISFNAVLVVLLSIVVLYVSIKFIRGKIYDMAFVGLSTKWYREVLELLKPRSRVLDVGIGTGMALINNKDLIEEKKIIIDGVDYDSDYITDCKKNIQRYGLENAIKVYCKSIYDYTSKDKYDAVYFGASLMIMPDNVKALKHVSSLLKPNGRIFITQTIQTQRSKTVEVVKPLLKYLTTIDFGNVTYENELMQTFNEAGLTVLDNRAIADSSMDSLRSYRLFVLEKYPSGTSIFDAKN